MAVTLHVALDPRDPAPADVAIVVDCIRATTTISHALDTGYASVTCGGEFDDAHAVCGNLDGGGLLLARRLLGPVLDRRLRFVRDIDRNRDRGLGRADEDGFFYITGRLKRFIKVMPDDYARVLAERAAKDIEAAIAGD